MPHRLVLLLGLLLALSVPAPFAKASAKQIVGATETVRVAESGMNFLGRVDTGAATSSIHATDIEFLTGSDSSGTQVGRRIAFSVINERGESCRLKARVEKLQATRTSEGREERLCVYLSIDWGGKTKRVLVNLNDRSAMKYPLLLGRNWLAGDFLVDVTKP